MLRNRLVIRLRRNIHKYLRYLFIITNLPISIVKIKDTATQKFRITKENRLKLQNLQLTNWINETLLQYLVLDRHKHIEQMYKSWNKWFYANIRSVITGRRLTSAGVYVNGPMTQLLIKLDALPTGFIFTSEFLEQFRKVE